MRYALIAIVSGLMLLPLSGLDAGSTTMPEELLLDHFARADGVSALGTRWEGFTDRVRGGRCDLQAGIATATQPRRVAARNSFAGDSR